MSIGSSPRWFNSTDGSAAMSDDMSDGWIKEACLKGQAAEGASLLVDEYTQFIRG